ncbi:MAG: hypothetical protein KR126chlam3_01038 [Chlamydiae bacterium]|nr:hypothetical protein [Chlamydiota bacterium]
MTSDVELKKPLEGKQSFFLFGPRGTGKTSWMKSKAPNGLYVDLLKHFNWIIRQQNLIFSTVEINAFILTILK